MAVFWLDESFDREHAADGHSRYGGELRERVGEFSSTWGDIAPVSFAAAAWLVATSLEPAYVRWHRRIVSATCVRSPWDGSLIAEVRLVAPWPAELTWTREWTRDQGWRDWPRMFGQYVTPSTQDLTRAPHLRASLLVEAPLRPDDLPPAPEGPEPGWEQSARRAVTVVVRELNDLLIPMLNQLDAEVPRT